MCLFPLTWTVMKAASALDKYEAFLISNVSTISTLESSLRSLTWFLPGRFKDAELVSEARQLPFRSSPALALMFPASVRLPQCPEPVP